MRKTTAHIALLGMLVAVNPAFAGDALVVPHPDTVTCGALELHYAPAPYLRRLAHTEARDVAVPETGLLWSTKPAPNDAVISFTDGGVSHPPTRVVNLYRQDPFDVPGSAALNLPPNLDRRFRIAVEQADTPCELRVGPMGMRRVDWHAREEDGRRATMVVLGVGTGLLLTTGVVLGTVWLGRQIPFR